MTTPDTKISTLQVGAKRLERVARFAGDDPAFATFMARVDRVISEKTGVGVYDLSDAPWRDLFDDRGDDVTAGEVFEILADYDDLFADIAGEF